MNTKNQPDPHGAYARALPDEPMFVLLARDPLAPEMLRKWADWREQLYGNTNDPLLPHNEPGQVEGVRQLAREMQGWRTENVNGPDGMPTWRTQAHLFEDQTETLGYDELAPFAGWLKVMIRIVHKRNERWWQDPATGEPIQRNVGELLMLMVSEIAEAMEGHRKSLEDEHLPHYRAFAVELADLAIRLFDLCGGLAPDMPDALVDKLRYNATRQDHTHAARLAEGGKKY